MFGQVITMETGLLVSVVIGREYRRFWPQIGKGFWEVGSTPYLIFLGVPPPTHTFIPDSDVCPLVEL